MDCARIYFNRIFWLGIFLVSPLTVPVFAKSSETVKIVMLGDSLTEGYGVARNAAYPALLQARLTAARKNVEIINAGESGSTTASGQSRLRWQLKGKPQIVVIALGANDMLRGVDLKQSEKNLDAMISLAKQNSVKVLLVGMRAPPNYGKAYDSNLRGIYMELAKKHSVPLIPFLLEGVAGEPKLNQGDGIHPNEEGHVILAATVMKGLLPLL